MVNICLLGYSFCIFIYNVFLFLRYNPDNLPSLERYVEIQSRENAYDLEANLAVLKLYQLNPLQYNIDITSQILLKALTNFPHTDFVLCKCLLSSRQVCFHCIIFRVSNWSKYKIRPSNHWSWFSIKWKLSICGCRKDLITTILLRMSLISGTVYKRTLSIPHS